jgi:hypothetical protein
MLFSTVGKLYKHYWFDEASGQFGIAFCFTRHAWRTNKKGRSKIDRPFLL